MAQKNVKFVGKTSILPISTMLYMSENDLQERLKILISLFEVDYSYICHKGEGEKKDHIHICLRSRKNGFRNIDKIRECLYEICDVDTEMYKKGQSKPCKPFVETKSLRDWYLYSMHNKQYLDSKNEVREFEYQPCDFKGSPCLIEDMQELTKNYVECESDLDIIIRGVQSELSTVDILKTLKGLDCTNIYSVIKGIEEVRKYASPDYSFYSEKIADITPYFLDNMRNCGLYDILDTYRKMEKGLKISPTQVLSTIIFHKMQELTKNDIVEACLSLTSGEPL